MGGTSTRTRSPSLRGRTSDDYCVSIDRFVDFVERDTGTRRSTCDGMVTKRCGGGGLEDRFVRRLFRANPKQKRFIMAVVGPQLLPETIRFDRRVGV